MIRPICNRNLFFLGFLFLFIIGHPISAKSFIIPDTGVTSCFDDQGNQIVCPEVGQPFYGQDAHYGPGTLLLTDNGDGTVSDENTGLMWEVKGVSDGSADPGNPNDPDNTYSWNELSDFIILLNASNHKGYSDWRIPTVKELETILDLSVAEPGPAMQSTLFPNCQSGSYWTSVPDVVNPAMVWSIDFSTSYDNITATSEKLYVRAVRGGM